MNLPTPYTVGVRRRTAGATDAHGNPVDTYSTVINVPVYGIAPASSNEPFDSGREAVVTGLTVLAPAGTAIDADDIVVWNGDEYSVEGEIADWSYGPFGWNPGVQINLRKVEG